MFKRLLPLLAAIVAVVGLAFAAQANQDEHHTAAKHGQMRAEAMKHGATMAAAYAADSLYVCPMHEAVISAQPDRPCPLCGMDLAPMDDARRAALREHPLSGCPMDPIVAETGTIADCPVCGMKLEQIERPASEEKAATMTSSAGCCSSASCSHGAQGAHVHAGSED